MTDDVQLERSVTLPLLVLYGLGTMVGGGFYALMGKVAGEAGMYAPLAMVLSGLLALLSSFSFAELSSRYPVSAGEARYVQEAFGRVSLATVVGWLVIATGVVSAAALADATVGFLQDLVRVPERVGIAALVLGMGAVAAWGIGQSVGLVAVITCIEVGALAYAAVVSGVGPAHVVERWPELVPPLEADVLVGIFSGAFLAFYAFIGFEDMVNIAEEVKGVRRNLPVAIVVSVSLTILVYLVITTSAVLTLTPETLASSNTPIAELVRGEGWFATTGIVVVSMLTGVNGALVQIVMASRVAYGMAGRGQAPGWLGAVHPRTRTPVQATIAVGLVVLALALFLPLATLAKATSAIILVVFASVNGALVMIKRRDPDPDGEGPRLPAWLPSLGLVSCVAVLAFQLWLLLAA